MYLWVKIKPPEGVYDQWVLGQPVVHDHMEALQEGRRLNDGLVVRVVQAL